MYPLHNYLSEEEKQLLFDELNSTQFNHLLSYFPYVEVVVPQDTDPPIIDEIILEALRLKVMFMLGSQTMIPKFTDISDKVESQHMFGFQFLPSCFDQEEYFSLKGANHFPKQFSPPIFPME